MLRTRAQGRRAGKLVLKHGDFHHPCLKLNLNETASYGSIQYGRNLEAAGRHIKAVIARKSKFITYLKCSNDSFVCINRVVVKSVLK